MYKIYQKLKMFYLSFGQSFQKIQISKFMHDAKGGLNSTFFVQSPLWGTHLPKKSGDFPDSGLQTSKILSTYLDSVKLIKDLAK